METKHHRWSEIPAEELSPMLERQVITGQNVMLARFFLRKGVVVPEHSHENEQVAYILEGVLKFTVAGKEIVVRAGEVLCIPPNVPHMAEALEDTIDLDVFSPPRRDWLDNKDHYLRGK